MRKKTDLYIRFFNEFSITSPHFEYAPSAHNSTQLTLLISYLVANQDAKIPKDVLMSMLWPDKKEECPVGALRNLVYRARKELQALYPDKDIDYIKFTQDAYYWSTDLYCKADIVDFENYNNLARHESDPERQFRYYYRMQRLYTGGFLSNHTPVEWVQYRGTYYKNMYINCILNMCEYLHEKERYDELISLCDQSIILYPQDERFYRHKLLAYLGMNTIKAAMEYYRATLDLFSSKYGTDISESLRDIHQEILAHIPIQNETILELDRTLRDDFDDDKTFYCSFDIFKKIYQLNMRTMNRDSRQKYLLLISLDSKKGRTPDTVKVKEAMDILFYKLSSHLRKNDVFTRTSLMQYSIILTVLQNGDIETVSSRIKDSFKNTAADFDFQLKLETKIIE